MRWPPVEADYHPFGRKTEGDLEVTLKIIINYVLLMLIVPLMYVKIFYWSGK
jgi:hypothetical protein